MLSARNKDKKREYDRLYRIKNKEKMNAYQKEYYLSHKEKVREIHRRYAARNRDAAIARSHAWYESHKESQRQKAFDNRDKRDDYELKRNFGISKEEFNSMLSKQDSCCAICGKPQSENNNHKRFAVDHDHKTGKVRGLLCRSCNLLLGHAQDDVLLLKSAELYLVIYGDKP